MQPAVFVPKKAMGARVIPKRRKLRPLGSTSRELDGRGEFNMQPAVVVPKKAMGARVIPKRRKLQSWVSTSRELDGRGEFNRQPAVVVSKKAMGARVIPKRRKLRPLGSTSRELDGRGEFSMQPAVVISKKAMVARVISKKPAARLVPKPPSRAMKSVIAKGRQSRFLVFTGAKERTIGGLKATDIVKNRYGKCVSKKASNRAKNNVWANAIKEARAELGITGFCTIGMGAEGKALYHKAKTILEQSRARGL